MAWLLMMSFAAFSAGAVGSHKVSGYVKKNGTRVDPYYATDPNKSKADNYSTKGNVNPHTSKKGSKK